MTDNQRILVACSLADSEKDNAALQAANWMAKMTGHRLVLMHVVEPWDFTGYGIPLLGIPQISDIEMRSQDARLKQAEDSLAKLAADLAPQTEIKIFYGSPVQWILAEGRNSFLTVVGTEFEGSSILVHFSYLASVLAQSVSPVWVIPTSFQASQLDRKALLFADNLRHHSDAALEFAIHLMAGWDGAKLMHLHASGLSEASLGSALEMATNNARAPELSGAEASQIFASFVSTIKARLADRFQNVLSQLKPIPRIDYQARVESGHPVQVVDKMRQEFQPSIEIYGRHHAIHRKPFGFGHMPLASMINGKSSVLIVPDRE